MAGCGQEEEVGGEDDSQDPGFSEGVNGGLFNRLRADRGAGGLF